MTAADDEVSEGQRGAKRMQHVRFEQCRLAEGGVYVPSHEVDALEGVAGVGNRVMWSKRRVE